MTSSIDACIDPTAITDDDVLAYALEEASGAAVDHIEHCSFCQSKAEPFREMALVLQQGGCPPSIKIGELVQGLLNAQEELVLSAHLRACPTCSNEKTRFAEFLAPDVPLGVAGVISGLRRLIAQPIAPSATAFAGLRGAAQTESRAYIADNALIYVNVDQEAPGRPRKVITGRLELRSGESDSAVASLFEGSQILVTEKVDDLGFFYFPALKTGTYRIEVTTADLQIVIEPLLIS